jgi:hypothetical protein
MLWDWDGTLERLHHLLYVATREREGREASPTAAIIDSQSAKAAQKGAARSTRRATMRARRSRGRKRYVLVDTLGLLLNVVVHPAYDKKPGSCGGLLPAHGFSQLLSLSVEARELGAQPFESIYVLGIVLIGPIRSAAFRCLRHWAPLPVTKHAGVS